MPRRARVHARRLPVQGNRPGRRTPHQDINLSRAIEGSMPWCALRRPQSRKNRPGNPAAPIPAPAGNCVDTTADPPYVGVDPVKPLRCSRVHRGQDKTMLHLSCCKCGSLFLVSELPAGLPLCPACHTVAPGLKKHNRPKRKRPSKKESTHGTDRST